jgi:two-component system chemotaxis response regulator CheY
MHAHEALAYEWEDESPTAPRRSPGVARILVVEDDDELRSTLASMLVEQGFAVEEAASGVAAVGILNESSGRDAFDLVITDQRMPLGLGLDLVGLLRRTGIDVPVIVMTAFPEAHIFERARELGAVVLAKPFRVEALTRTAIALLLGRTEGTPESGGAR